MSTVQSLVTEQLVLQGPNTTPTSSQTQPQHFRFDAFISYSRQNTSFARSLQCSLEKKFKRFSKKLRNSKPHLMLCRDETDFTSAGDLSQVVIQRITESRKLLVICSPESRSAIWVNKEIECFRKTHGTQGNEGMIAVLFSGEDPVKEHAMPAALVLNAIEPLAVEFRREKIEPETSYSRYCKDDGLIRILAPILETEYPILKNRHQEYERQRLRRHSLFFGMLAIIFALLAAGIWFFYNEADKQRSKAESTLHDALSGYASAAMLNIKNGHPNEATNDLNYTIELAMAVPPDKDPSTALLWYTFVTDFFELGEAFEASNDMKSAAQAFAKALVIQRWLLDVAKRQSGKQVWNDILSGTTRVLGQRHGKEMTYTEPWKPNVRSILAQWHDMYGKIKNKMERFQDSQQAIRDAVTTIMNSGKSYGRGVKQVTLRNGKSYEVSTYDGVPVPVDNHQIRMTQLGFVRDGSGQLQWAMSAELKEKGGFLVTITTPMDDALSTSFSAKGPDILQFFFSQTNHPTVWDWMNESGTAWVPFSFNFRRITSGKEFEVLQWARFDSYHRKYLQNEPVQSPNEHKSINKASGNTSPPVAQSVFDANPISIKVAELLSIGDKELGQGHNSEAKTSYEAALKTLEPTVKEDSADVASRRLLAITYVRIAARESRDWVLGMRAYGRSSEIGRSLLRIDSDNEDVRSDLSKIYMQMGFVAIESEDTKKAKEAFLHSINFSQEALRAKPTDFEDRRNMANSLNNLGILEMRSNHLSEASVWYQKALEIRKGLLQLNPNNSEWLKELLLTHLNIALCNRKKGDVEATVLHVQAGTEILTKLTNEGALASDKEIAEAKSVFNELRKWASG